MIYDFLIVGSGFYGAICARELTDAGFNVCVIESRNHIGGNCFTSNKNGINIHEYGPHIFHTSNETVWSWINKYVSFNSFVLRPVANYHGEIYSLPFNMWTFAKLWNISLPEEAKKIISEQAKYITNPRNLEEQAIALVGIDVYNKLIKGYTEKQWRKKANTLPKEIITRIPVRYTYDNNYFNDKYQGIPIGGYTQIFDKLLNGIEVRINTDYFTNDNPQYNRLIYTGPIDKFFNYEFGRLEYKTTKFEHELLNKSDYQGTAMMNFTDSETPFTRIIEHKHFEFIDNPKTWITKEYPVEYNSENSEPFYPVNDEINNNKYLKYAEKARLHKNMYFGGRLAEYKYFDMHQIIELALKRTKEIINEFN